MSAWSAALLYTFQLYFDFSGYSDMAIGLARMFGITLPVNFLSPYRATSIIEFWRQWHITLSRFLRDFIYVPLGGRQHGWMRRYENLMITMLLGGLWHGAGWTFVIWGGLHGLYLCLNHGWRAVSPSFSRDWLPSQIRSCLSWLVTFVAVVIAWVCFRASDFYTAIVIWRNMLIGHHATIAVEVASVPWTLLCVAAIIALLMPNAYQWLRDYKPAEHFEYRSEQVWCFLRFMRWEPSISNLIIVLIMGCWAIFQLEDVREFIYFRF